MTVALLLAAAPDRLSAMAHPYQRPGAGPAIGAPWLDFMGDRLMSAGARQVDVAMCADAADGLRAVAAIARATSEPVLVWTSSRALATPGADLATLLGQAGAGAAAAGGALLVDSTDLPAVAEAAEALAASIATGRHPGRPHLLSPRRAIRRTRVNAELDSAVDWLIECLSGNGVRVAGPGGNPSGNGRDPAAPTARGGVRRPAFPPEPGLVTGLAVAPVAGRLARSAPLRGLAPDAFTIASFALSVCAAAWFASGGRSSMAAGAALLCVALPVRQARGWLAASRPAASAYGDWLAAVSGAAAEYAVYAGLAVGWAGASPRRAWGYATAAMILLAVRQMTDGCYAAVAAVRPAPAGTARRLMRLAGQSIALPAGERALLIAVTAAAWGAHIALAALIGWGAVALGYVLAERSVAGRPPAPVSPAAARALAVYRDDGPLALRLGGLAQGQLPPLLPAVAGITVTAILATLGLRNLPGLLLLAPAVAMLLAALGAGSPHTGRLDWLVPPLLQAGQYLYLAAIAFPAGVPPPATYVLVAAIALHHIDLLHRERRGMAPSPGATAAGLGWEGRMLVAGFGGMLGIETFLCIALAGYLWALFGWDSITSWVTATSAGSRPVV